MSHPAKVLTQKKVFVSYRREPGSETAQRAHGDLKQRGFMPFTDVEDLRGGPFNMAPPRSALVV